MLDTVVVARQDGYARNRNRDEERTEPHSEYVGMNGKMPYVLNATEAEPVDVEHFLRYHHIGLRTDVHDRVVALVVIAAAQQTRLKIEHFVRRVDIHRTQRRL